MALPADSEAVKIQFTAMSGGGEDPSLPCFPLTHLCTHNHSEDRLLITNLGGAHTSKVHGKCGISNDDAFSQH